MRTIITIPDEYKKSLDEISKCKKVTRTELIRQAIANYIHNQKQTDVDAFGLWKKRNINALKYEKKLRDEWE